MKYKELIEEFKKRGIKHKYLPHIPDNKTAYGWEQGGYTDKDNKVYVEMFGGCIDDDGCLHPYQLFLWGKVVVGNKRLLKMVDELLGDDIE